MKPIDMHPELTTRCVRSLPPAQRPATTSSHRHAFMGMVLITMVFVTPTDKTNAATPPSETFSASLVNTTFAAPVGLYAIQESDSIETAQQPATEADERPQDTSWPTRLQHSIENNRPIVSQVLAVVITLAVVLELISRMLQHVGKKSERRRWCPHVLATVLATGPVAYLYRDEGVITVIEIYAVAALLGLMLGALARKRDDKTDPLLKEIIPKTKSQTRREEYEERVKSFSDTVREHAEFIARMRMVDIESESNAISSSDRPSKQ